MNPTQIELYGLDLLVELDPPSANPVGPAHAGQAGPTKIGDRVHEST
jgi:hypothetical protein